MVSDPSPVLSLERWQTLLRARFDEVTLRKLELPKEPVTFAFGRHVMHARGMQADLKAGNLQLESEVSGLFTP